ncbi:MAG: hypothetical protein Q4E51_05345 [Lachnospiraceae bacterium]|nr:hypothetical protein [Lachnospiraceae bacterium]
MIVLSECSEDILKRINELNNIIPSFMNNDDEEDTTSLENPFIRYIREKGMISNDLLEFLEHSEFLQNLTQETLEYSIRLYDALAQVEWYGFFQTLFDQEGDNYEEFYELVFRCFSSGIDFENTYKVYDEWNHEDINSLKDLYSALIESHNIPDENDSSDDPVKSIIEEEEKKAFRQADEMLSASYKELVDQQKDYIDSLKADLKKVEDRCELVEAEKSKLSEQLSEIFNNLENSYAIGQESKRENLKLKAEVEHIRKTLESKDKFIKQSKEKNSEYILRIQELDELYELEKTRVSDLESSAARLKASLEEKESMIESLTLQLNEMSLAAEKYRQEIESLSKGKPNVSEEEFYDEDDPEEEFFDDSVNLNDDDVDDFVSEPETEEEIIEEVEEEVDKDIEYFDIVPFKQNTEVVRKKSNWFSRMLFNFSKKNFVKQTREEQEGMIFVKMMEQQFPMQTAKLVRQALNKLGDAIPCFELYKLICNNPSDDELASFFAEYSSSMASE